MVYFKKFTILLIIAAILKSVVSVSAVSSTPEFRNFAGRAAILAEVDSGQILFERNKNMRLPADGLARLMTLKLAVAAIERGDADPFDLVEMTHSAWENISSACETRNILPEEQMTLLDLMYSAFVGNASEAANLIAEHIAGSVREFVTMMNSAAEDLGLENTNFVNAHGRHNSAQVTTAADQFEIFRHAMTFPLFAEISSTLRHTTRATNMSESRTFVSTNELLNAGTKYYFTPSLSGIVSATFEGGHSYVGFAETEGMSLIVVVLGSDVIMHPDGSATMRNLSEAQRLFTWGFANFGWHTILGINDLVARAPVTHGAGADFVNLRPESSIVMVLYNDFPMDSFIRTPTIYSVAAGTPLFAPIEAGEVLGEITITRAGVEYGTVLLVANTNIELNRLEYIRMQISDILDTSTARAIIAILAVLVTGYIALVVRYNLLRRRRINEIAAAKAKLAEERKQNEDEYQY